jgi:uncharacterized protein (TIGR03435 family)
MRARGGFLLSTAFLLSAQTQSPAVFEIASVKPSHSRSVNEGGQKGSSGGATPTFEVDRLTFRARSVTLFTLIVEAYGLKFCRPLAETCPMVSGGPAWIAKDRFDIDAKGATGSIAYDTSQLRNGDAPQLQEKIRNLLAERFALKAHLEKRQLPVFAFTVAQGGIRMKPAKPGESASLKFKQVNPSIGPPVTDVVAVNSTVQELADLYSKFMDHPVIDMAGLSGRFDFTVEYEADTTDSPGPFAAVTAPTLFQAFEKQAGLKLRTARGPVDVLIIDQASRPSAN